MRAANLGLRFILELSAIAAAAYWGFTTGSGVTSVLLGLAAPAAVIVVWGLFVSPKRRFELPHPLRFAIELAVFAGAALGLIAAGQAVLGVVLAVLAVVSGALNYAWS